MAANNSFSLYFNEKGGEAESLGNKKKSKDHIQSLVKYVTNALVRKFILVSIFREISDQKLHTCLQTLLEHMARSDERFTSLRRQNEQMRYQMQFMTIGIQHKDDYCLGVQRQNLNLKTMLTKSCQDLASTQRVALLSAERTLKQNSSQEKRLVQILDNANVHNSSARSPQRGGITYMRSNSTKPITLIRKQQQLKEEAKKQSNDTHHQDFLQSQTGWAFLKMLLDLEVQDRDVMKMYDENEHQSKLRILLTQSDDTLHHVFTSLNEKECVLIIETLRYLLGMADCLLDVVVKLKRVTKVVQVVSHSMQLGQTFTSMVEETCKIFPCDRVRVYLVDSKRGELWCRSGTGTQNIKMPLNQGIVGHVYQTGEGVNILDATKDKRFMEDKDDDNNNKNNNKYQTKNMLCVPIMDLEQKCVVGVLQATNKLGHRAKNHFTKNDEGIMSILARLCSSLFRTSLYHDGKELHQQLLMQFVECGIQLQACQTMQQLIREAECYLSRQFDFAGTRIYFYDPRQQLLYRYDEEALRITVDTKVGILGEVFRTQTHIQAMDDHSEFDDTRIICMPIKDSDNRTVGVLQCSNQKGIENPLYQQGRSPQIETLANFCLIVAKVYRELLNIEEGM